MQDVLVATDVASKGLDFPDIQHVINYDMPDEIENYVSAKQTAITFISVVLSSAAWHENTQKAAWRVVHDLAC